MIDQVLQVREGYIGNLKTGDATGPLQWEFLERWPEKEGYRDVIEELGQKTLE